MNAADLAWLVAPLAASLLPRRLLASGGHDIQLLRVSEDEPPAANQGEAEPAANG